MDGETQGHNQCSRQKLQTKWCKDLQIALGGSCKCTVWLESSANQSACTMNIIIAIPTGFLTRQTKWT